MKKMYEVPGFAEKRPGKIIELCEYLAPRMNELHGTGYSVRFWSMLLKDYAKSCVNRELLMSDLILHTRPAISPMDGWELPSRKDRWRARMHELAMAVYDRNPMSEINRILKQNHNICVGIRGKVFEEFGLGTYCPVYHGISSFFLDSGLRKKIESIAGNDECTFIKNVLLQLPRFFVEDFKKNISRIEIHEPQKKIFHAEHLSDMMDLIIALYVENGAKYYRYQLGAWAGETQNSMTPEHYIGIDRFRTFGWKIHKKDEPHVAYRLEQFSRSYHAFKPIESHDLCIVYNQVNVSNKERYKHVSDTLFKSLDFQKYSKVLLRPRGHTRKLDNSGELAFLKAPSNVVIGKGKRPMHEIVKKSRVMVQLSLPSTNFLECIYVNHPIASIFTVKNPTDIIKPYYHFFLDQQVLHEDADSLVRHLNTVDLEKWWGDVTSHPMYSEFKEKFARKVE